MSYPCQYLSFRIGQVQATTAACGRGPGLIGHGVWEETCGGDSPTSHPILVWLVSWIDPGVRHLRLPARTTGMERTARKVGRGHDNRRVAFFSSLNLVDFQRGLCHLCLLCLLYHLCRLCRCVRLCIKRVKNGIY